MRVLFFCFLFAVASAAWCAEPVYTIAGKVEVATGDILPATVGQLGPRKRAAPNVVVYAIPAKLLPNGVPLRRDDVLALTRQANAYDITDEQGRFHLPVTGGQRYRVLAMIGPAVHVAAGDVVDRAVDSQSIVVDRTTR